VLTHPRACVRVARRTWPAAAALEERAARDVAGWHSGGRDAAGL